MTDVRDDKFEIRIEYPERTRPITRHGLGRLLMNGHILKVCDPFMAMKGCPGKAGRFLEFATDLFLRLAVI